jgi:hypothetical protein
LPARSSRIVRSTAGDFQFAGQSELAVVVLLNLLRNALRAMQRAGKGRVRIIDGAHPPPRLLFIDTGCGIAASHLPLIFRRFYSYPAHNGSGIGLALCQEIMQAWDARIRCVSRESAYAIFVLEFPSEVASSSTEVTHASARLPHHPDRAGRRQRLLPAQPVVPARSHAGRKTFHDTSKRCTGCATNRPEDGAAARQFRHAEPAGRPVQRGVDLERIYRIANSAALCHAVGAGGGLLDAADERAGILRRRGAPAVQEDPVHGRGR